MSIAPVQLTMDRDPTPAEALAAAAAAPRAAKVKGGQQQNQKANSVAAAALKSPPATPPEPISAAPLSTPADSAELTKLLKEQAAITDIVTRHFTSSKDMPPKTALQEIAARLGINIVSQPKVDIHKKLKELALSSLPQELKIAAEKNDIKVLLQAHVDGKVRINPLLDYLMAYEHFKSFPNLLRLLAEKKHANEALQQDELLILDKAATIPDTSKMNFLVCMLEHFKTKVSLYTNNYESEKDGQGTRFQHLSSLSNKFVELHAASVANLKKADEIIAERNLIVIPQKHIEAIAVKNAKSPANLTKGTAEYDVETERLKSERQALKNAVQNAETYLDGFISEFEKYQRTLKDEKKVEQFAFVDKAKTERFNTDLFVMRLAEYNAFLKASHPDAAELKTYTRYVESARPIKDTDLITKTLSDCAREFAPLETSMRKFRKDEHFKATKALEKFKRTYETFIEMHNLLVSTIEPINMRMLAAKKYVEKKDTQKKLTESEILRYSERTTRSTGEISDEDNITEKKYLAAKEFIKLHEAPWLEIISKLNSNELYIQYMINTYKDGGTDRRELSTYALIGKEPLDNVTKRLSTEVSADSWNG